jgi:hypothetical protein
LSQRFSQRVKLIGSQTSDVLSVTHGLFLLVFLALTKIQTRSIQTPVIRMLSVIHEAHQDGMLRRIRKAKAS